MMPVRAAATVLIETSLDNLQIADCSSPGPQGPRRGAPFCHILRMLQAPQQIEAQAPPRGHMCGDVT
jgi:hypothetical protein